MHRAAAAAEGGDMTDTFKAILVSRDENKKQSVAVTQLTDADLMEGDVTVAVEGTTVNYKDGLASTGKAPGVRRAPRPVAGRQPLSPGRGHRFRRNGDFVGPCVVESR